MFFWEYLVKTSSDNGDGFPSGINATPMCRCITSECKAAHDRISLFCIHIPQSISGIVPGFIRFSGSDNSRISSWCQQIRVSKKTYKTSGQPLIFLKLSGNRGSARVMVIMDFYASICTFIFFFSSSSSLCHRLDRCREDAGIRPWYFSRKPVLNNSSQ